MPNYEISSHRDDGTIVLKYSLQCSDDLRAKSLAHALRAREGRSLEVWRGEELIHTEPRLQPH